MEFRVEWLVRPVQRLLGRREQNKSVGSSGSGGTGKLAVGVGDAETGLDCGIPWMGSPWRVRVSSVTCSCRSPCLSFCAGRGFALDVT
jgi:hypothetical protein